MAFITLANKTDAIEMTAFPEVYRQNLVLLEPGQCIAVKGKLSIRNDEPTILVERVRSLAPETVSIPVDTEPVEA